MKILPTYRLSAGFFRLLTVMILLSGPSLLKAQNTGAEDSTASTYPGSEDTTTLGDRQETTHEAAVLRQVPDSTVKNLKADKDFAYANDPEYWAKEKKKNRPDNHDPMESFWNFFSKPGVRAFFYIFLFAVIIFIIYKIAVANNLLFFRSARKISLEGGEDEDETDGRNIDDKISQAARDKNYRLAVRLLYLKSLQILRDKGRLQLHAQATNYDYVKQMRKYPESDKFSYLTRAFEYVWYGEFELTDDQFSYVHHEFQNFHNIIRR